jgi:uncharacterized heparinase superfamily protein
VNKIVSRLRAIGPHPLLLAHYVGHRYATRIGQRRLRRSYPRRVASVPEGASLVLPTLDLPPARALPAALQPAAERIRDEAEMALRHEADVLGSGAVALGEQIDWQRDFKSGYRWPASHYMDVEVTRLTDDSDAKVPWELSRCHQLLTLARAAALWEEELFAEELEQQLEAWIEANPPGLGINWTNPMEVAIRAVNWVWAVATLESWRPLRPDVRSRVTTSLQVHARHVAANLEGTPWLRSNHYLADVLGLLVVGAVVRDDPAAESWLTAGRLAFEREIQTQVYPDGLAFEASLPYHALVLEMFLLAHFVSGWARRPLSPQYDRRLALMVEATNAVRHPDGRLPQFGDGDSGRIVPAGIARPPSADHLLWLAAALLGTDAPMGGTPHEEVAWTLGADAWISVAARPVRQPPSGTAFERGGVYILRGGGFHTAVRCGDVGQNGNGGHSHNDALSFELSFAGRPILVDPGTYAYTSDAAARHAFRSTRAHNTVAVAGHEINPIDQGRVFELPQFAHPQVLIQDESEAIVRLVASHDGYRRLTPPVVHQRTFLLDREHPSLRVSDELLGTGDQIATSWLHFAPGTTLTAQGQASFMVSCAEVRLQLAVDGAAEIELLEGWVSDRFGVRAAAPVLALGLRGSLPHLSGVTFMPMGSE